MGTERKHREIGLGWVGFLLVLAITLGTASLPPVVSVQAGASDSTTAPTRPAMMLPAVDIFARARRCLPNRPRPTWATRFTGCAAWFATATMARA